jgi:hypothetical protein
VKASKCVSLAAPIGQAAPIRRASGLLEQSDERADWKWFDDERVKPRPGSC